MAGEDRQKQPETIPDPPKGNKRIEQAESTMEMVIPIETDDLAGAQQVSLADILATLAKISKTSDKSTSAKTK